MPVTRRTGRVDRTAKENVPADPEDMASSLANDFDPPPQQPTRRRGGAVSVSSATRSAAQAPLAESASSSSTSPMPPPSRRAMVRGGDRPALAQVNTADGRPHVALPPKAVGPIGGPGQEHQQQASSEVTRGFATPSSVGRRQLSSRSNSGVPGRGPIGGPPSQAIHQSSPSSTLEPTPLGSIQLDGEMDAEASGDGSSDLLLKFGFAESFADSPERSSPRHPRQGAASDKERPHQQKQQQRRRQQPPSSATSQPVQLMWQHSEGPHMAHAAGAHSFAPPYGYPGADMTAMSTLNQQSLDPSQQAASPSTGAPQYPPPHFYYQGYTPQQHPGFASPFRRHAQPYSQATSGGPMDAWPSQHPQQQQWPGGVAPASKTPSPQSKKRPDENANSTPPSGKKPKSASNSFLMGLTSPSYGIASSSPFRSPDKGAGIYTGGMTKTPNSYYVLDTPGRPSNADLSNLDLFPPVSSSFGFDPDESIPPAPSQADGGSPWPSLGGGVDAKTNMEVSGQPTFGSNQGMAINSLYSNDFEWDDPSPPPNEVPYQSPARRGLDHPTSSPGLGRPSPAIMAQWKPMSKASKSSSSQQSMVGGSAPYRLKLGADSISKGLKTINSLTKGERSATHDYSLSQQTHGIFTTDYRTPRRNKIGVTSATPSGQQSKSLSEDKRARNGRKITPLNRTMDEETPKHRSRTRKVSTPPPPASTDSKNERQPCNCRKSRCLKLYCECFSAQVFCDGCKCINCQNTPKHSEVRRRAIRETKNKNPNAFKEKIGSSKHNNGCTCKKSRCLKKYCECFQNGVLCAAKCKCSDCENYEGSIALADRRRKIKDPKSAEVAKESWGGGSASKGPPRKRLPPSRAPAPIPNISVGQIPSVRSANASYPNPSTHHHGAPHAPHSRAPHASSMMHMQPMMHPGPSPHGQYHHLHPAMMGPYTGHPTSHIHHGAAMLPQMEAAMHAAASAAGSAGRRNDKKPAKKADFVPHKVDGGAKKSINNGDASVKRKEAQTPKTPTSTPKKRLPFDPLSSKKKRNMSPGQEEPSKSYFGDGMPAQPKTAALAILSFLSNQDLFHTSLVNKEWNELSLDDELWQLECVE